MTDRAGGRRGRIRPLSRFPLCRLRVRGHFCRLAPCDLSLVCLFVQLSNIRMARPTAEARNLSTAFQLKLEQNYRFLLKNSGNKNESCKCSYVVL